MKAKIWEFDPVIYPLKLWVAIHPTQEDLEDTFLPKGDENVVAEWPEEYTKQSAVATTIPVWHEKNDTYLKGILVAVWNKELYDVGVCAHEALHCVDWMCDTMSIAGSSYDDDEAKAYLIQWVSNCLWSAVEGQAVKMKGSIIK